MVNMKENKFETMEIIYSDYVKLPFWKVRNIKIFTEKSGKISNIEYELHIQNRIIKSRLDDSLLKNIIGVIYEGKEIWNISDGRI